MKRSGRTSKVLILSALVSVLALGVRAQDTTDYLKHRKIFDYCTVSHVCEGCYTCEQNRYEIKIKNNQDKKIKSVQYQLYSSLYHHIETKDAKIEGGVITAQQVGFLYICVPDVKHWAISQITYDDGSTVTLTVKGGLGNFLQEPDECDCNY